MSHLSIRNITKDMTHLSTQESSKSRKLLNQTHKSALAIKTTLRSGKGKINNLQGEPFSRNPHKQSREQQQSLTDSSRKQRKRFPAFRQVSVKLTASKKAVEGNFRTKAWGSQSLGRGADLVTLRYQRNKQRDSALSQNKERSKNWPPQSAWQSI